MDEPFIGQIALYSFAFAPTGWAICNGATIQITQNQALASLLGNYFGGDLRTFFNLPDMRGRASIFADNSAGRTLGNSGGVDSIALPSDVLPAHMHLASAMSTPPTVLSPQGAALATLPSNGTTPITGLYTTASTSQAAMAGIAVGTAGASQPMENRQPSLALNFCIATAGSYPPRP
ncbi:phage tail protein [Magnetospirillum sulfuroxidans]|uniref:Tail fiber protein n=1 Tax=Magnetospirillum sulfuroxidans TaxID=611300 RepID=A0ABS5IA49_9PROT|nr:tail fiber protein [Magnetospirillum sulfuroxidans]